MLITRECLAPGEPTRASLEEKEKEKEKEKEEEEEEPDLVALVLLQK